VIAGVPFRKWCKIACELGTAKIAHKLANLESPPPLAVAGMLGLSPTSGQDDAAHDTYDFSLVFPLIIPLFQAFEGHLPETVNL
jgi:hypothetical protein